MQSFIHFVLMTAAIVTGRFSSSNPNLQQIPARDPEIKSIIRGVFLPEEDEKWGSFDYASQEPRWLAHYCASISGVHRHPSIDDVVEQYQNDDADFHQMVADMAVSLAKMPRR